MYSKNRVNLSTLLKTYIIGSILVAFLFYIIVKNSSGQFDPLTIVLFGIIIIYSFFSLMNSIIKKPYSFEIMHWFFMFVFYGIAGFVQYLNNRFIYSLNVTENIIQSSLILVIIWMIFFKFFYRYRLNMATNSIVNRIINSRLKYSKSFMTFSTIISLLILAYILSTAGFESFLSRNTGNLAFGRDTAAESLMFSSFLRNSIVYGFAISYIHYKKHRRGRIHLIIQGICLIIVNSPVSMARFNVAIVYLGLMVLMFPILKKGRNFFLVFFFSFIVIFPLINAFRYTTLTNVSIDVLTSTLENITENFKYGDYDAFTMILYTKKYVLDYGISFGLQLLGPLLFFVPRSLWALKPIGSGALVLKTYGNDFINGSSPLIAEALINFGIFGVVLFALFFSAITSYIERSYWKNENTGENYTMISILYPFLLSMFFFMLRGDLMSTFSFFVSHISIFLIMFWINNNIFARLTVKL